MLPGLSSADEIKARVLFFLSAAIDRSACPRPISRLRAMSGVRESNPPPRLGKPMHYRCANTARCFRYFPKNGAKILLFFDIRKSLIIFYVFLEKTHRFICIFRPLRGTLVPRFFIRRPLPGMVCRLLHSVAFFSVHFSGYYPDDFVYFVQI